MTRSLEGKVFYEDQNNGVTAITSAASRKTARRVNSIIAALGGHNAAHELQARQAVKAALVHFPRAPIFTFADSERVRTSPWFTGNDEFFSLLKEYIVDNGGRVEQDDVWVPFSNGAEMGYLGPEAQIAELRHVTTDEDFVAEFGISPEDLSKSWC